LIPILGKWLFWPCYIIKIQLFKRVLPWQLYEYLLEPVGRLEDYRKARNPTSGKTMNNFVLDALDPKLKKQGTTGSTFNKERGFFQDVMQSTFYELMVSSC